MKSVFVSLRLALFKLHHRQGCSSPAESWTGRTIFVMFSLLFFLLFLSPGQAAQRPIRIGVVSMITPVDTVKYYQDLHFDDYGHPFAGNHAGYAFGG